MSPPEPVIPFAGCTSTDPQVKAQARLVFAGLPADSQSSFRGGAASAPERIRCAYDGRCYNACSESGVDLTASVADLGDWQPLIDWDATANSYRQSAAALFRAGRIPFFAGGDHAVTIPIVQALAGCGRAFHVVQIDAHPDLYPSFDGDPHSHACVAARILELPQVLSLTQIGIRTLEPVQRSELDRLGERIRIHYARDVGSRLEPPRLEPEAPVYLTLDLDGLDPAFAPGVAHPVPGGLSSRQVLDLLQQAPWNLAGMDVVELNPELDRGDRTAVLAGRLLHEGMALAAKRSGTAAPSR